MWYMQGKLYRPFWELLRLRRPRALETRLTVGYSVVKTIDHTYDWHNEKLYRRHGCRPRTVSVAMLVEWRKYAKISRDLTAWYDEYQMRKL